MAETIIKRDGRTVPFEKEKIYTAIMMAMKFGSGLIKEQVAIDIAEELAEYAKMRDSVSVTEIESMVFSKLIDKDQLLTAKAYEGYRSVREFQRNTKNTTDKTLFELLAGKNEYWNEENSNKDAMLVTTQRDYMAGIQSTDMSRRILLTPDVVQAHDDGIIHFHK